MSDVHELSPNRRTKSLRTLGGDFDDEQNLRTKSGIRAGKVDDFGSGTNELGPRRTGAVTGRIDTGGGKDLPHDGLWSRRSSSPWILRQPQVGFSLASRMIVRRRSGSMVGRLGSPACVVHRGVEKGEDGSAVVGEAGPIVLALEDKNLVAESENLSVAVSLLANIRLKRLRTRPTRKDERFTWADRPNR